MAWWLLLPSYLGLHGLLPTAPGLTLKILSYVTGHTLVLPLPDLFLVRRGFLWLRIHNQALALGSRTSFGPGPRTEGHMPPGSTQEWALPMRCMKTHLQRQSCFVTLTSKSKPVGGRPFSPRRQAMLLLAGHSGKQLNTRFLEDPAFYESSKQGPMSLCPVPST